jgi:tetratricopeptide (TPR) repeat protein
MEKYSHRYASQGSPVKANKSSRHAPRAVRRLRPCACCFIALLSLAFAFPQPSLAQRGGQSRAVPRDDYFLVLNAMHGGIYREGLEAFQDVAGGGIRNVDGRWVDSICYFTRIGECYYHQGDLAAALEQYNAAVRLYVAHSDWMLRMQFPDLAPDPTNRLANIAWGAPGRPINIGKFPDVMLSQRGRIDNENVLRQGGVVLPPELVPVRASEVAYCTALAIRRRRELMGSTCPHDPLTATLVETLSRRPAPPNSWAQSWVSVLLGLAYSSGGQKQQAIGELQRGILAGGTYDHPLTSTALLELGKLSIEGGEHEAANTFFYEATFPAVAFVQPDVVEEAFRLGSDNFLATNDQGVYPPLAPAIEFCRRKDAYRSTAVSLLVAAADNFSARGDNTRAAKLLGDAQQAARRTDILTSDIGARYYHQLAQVNYQQGNLTAGNTALAAMLAWEKAGSKWLFQIGLADTLYVTNVVSPRVAENLFIELLREPTAKDWTVNVRETLSVTLTPHLLPMEHWFEVTLARKDHERAIEITDLVRRHRFYSSLPMGGRLLNLRWILEAPESALPAKAVLQRQDLLNRYPDYAALGRSARAIRTELAALPAAGGVEDKATQDKRKELYEKLNQVSGAQEILLRSIALRREPADLVFPPVKKLQEVQQQMGEGQIAFTYFATSRYVFGMAIARDKFNGWQIEAPREVTKKVTDLLRAMGHYDANKALDGKDLASESWKPIARELLSLLTDNPPPEFWNNYQEAIFVPDSVLWYLPFEALQVGSEEKTQSLLAKMPVRYAPTISLITPDGRAVPRDARSAVVAGRLFPRWRDEETQAALDEIIRALPKVETFADFPASSGLLAKAYDRVVIMDDVEDVGGPYEYSPMQLDRGKPGSSLARWMMLPWGSPAQVVAPGFHTAAENGLRKSGTGDEIFLTACAFYASGGRTVLLSRWRTGGQSSIDLTREFVQELPFAPASHAWRRSVELLRAGELDPELEPRVTGVDRSAPLPPDHPFFWAGYLLLDTGASPIPAASAAPADLAAPAPMPMP